MSERRDRELVAAVLDGERGAYRLLVERHEASLYRRACAILRDPEQAADAVQDAFLRAYERLDDCSDPDRFGGWVYRMLRNRCFDELRSPRRRARPLTAAAGAASGDDPAADLERGDIRRAVAAALESLTPPLREAFVLKHVDGLSYEEMQEVTGAARSALKMRVKRAREELERLLRPELGDPEDVTPTPADPSIGVEAAGPLQRGQI